MTHVSYIVPPTYRAASDPSQVNKNPNDPNMVTTGAYGNAFDMALNATTNADGTTTDTLTFKNYAGQTNGTFSAVSETGSGSDLSSAYQSLLSTMQANGEMDDTTASQLKGAFGSLQTKSQNGSIDATVSGGAMLVAAGGPVYFKGISAYQNNAVDSLINNLTSDLQHNSIA
jgi:superoxide dismutase